MLSLVINVVNAANSAADTADAPKPAAGASADDDGEPEADAAPAAEPAKPAVQELAVVETAFGKDIESDMWWYAVVLENPNPDHVFPSARMLASQLAGDPSPHMPSGF